MPNEEPRQEVTIKIEDDDGDATKYNKHDNNKRPRWFNFSRNNSYSFEDDGGGTRSGGVEGGGARGFLDPPTRLIGSFLRRSSGSDALDPSITSWSSNNNDGSSRKSNGDVPTSSPYLSQRRSTPRTSGSLRARSRREAPKNNLDRYSRTATRSRLVDPPPPPPRSTEMRSRMEDQQPTGNAPEEEDPLESEGGDGYPRGGWNWNFWTYFHLILLVIAVVGLIAAFKVSAVKHRDFLGLELWRWAVIILVVPSGKLLSSFLVRLLVMFIERNFMLRKRLLYFVYGLHKGVERCLWFGFVLGAWKLVFDPKLNLPTRTERRTLEVITDLLVCLVVGAALWLLKILLVKVLALSFHVNTYFDRIQESLFHQYILETLSGPPVIEVARLEAEQDAMTQVCESIENHELREVPREPAAPKSGMLRRSHIIGARSGDKKEEGFSIHHLQRLNQENVTAWNMKRLIRLVRSSRITTLAHNSSSMGGTGTEDKEINTEWEAKAAAKRLFKNVATFPDSTCLRLEDFYRFLGPDEAVKAFELFDGAPESGKITKQALVNWVVNVYRERRALKFSLNDTKTAVNKLHRIIDVIMGIIILIISCLILGIATTHLLVVISSQLVLIAFVFGNSCKTAFEAIIFLFAMHPFDVGDRCVVDGVQMVVEEMNILTTVFLRYDNEKIYYPNSVLATKPISNFYRSPDMGDAIDFDIHISTPNEKIEALKERIKEYIEKHLHHWHPNPVVVLKDVEDMNRMKMALWLRHTMNHQDAGEKWIRRSSLLLYLKDVFQELGIDYRLLPQELKINDLQLHRSS